MFSHHFTPQEVNTRLPLIKSITQEIIDKGQILRALLEEYQGFELPPETERLRDQIQALLAELEILGCYYKDWNFSVGIVDFPAMIEGHEVLLSWRADESDIRFYHGIDDGYAARKPIPQDMLEAVQV